MSDFKHDFMDDRDKMLIVLFTIVTTILATIVVFQAIHNINIYRRFHGWSGGSIAVTFLYFPVMLLLVAVFLGTRKHYEKAFSQAKLLSRFFRNIFILCSSLILVLLLPILTYLADPRVTVTTAVTAITAQTYAFVFVGFITGVGCFIGYRLTKNKLS